MSIKIGLRITLSGLDPLCKKIKYDLTVNSTAVATGVIVDRPAGDILIIDGYPTDQNFVDTDVVSLNIYQGTAYRDVSGSSQSGEVTYSSAHATGNITINYTAPSQPSAPSISHTVSMLDPVTLALSVDFALSSVDTTADKVQYSFSVVSAVTGDTYNSPTYAISITPNSNFAIYEGGLLGSPAGKDIIINRVLGTYGPLQVGDQVTLTVAVGVPLGDGTSYFSTNATDSATLTIPAPGGSPATPGATVVQYGFQ